MACRRERRSSRRGGAPWARRRLRRATRPPSPWSAPSASPQSCAGGSASTPAAWRRRHRSARAWLTGGEPAWSSRSCSTRAT
eukprot:1501285-Prymnesium_polylepis.1